MDNATAVELLPDGNGTAVVYEPPAPTHLPQNFCSEWQPAQHWAFHFSMIFFLLASSVPYTQKWVQLRRAAFVFCPLIINQESPLLLTRAPALMARY